MNYSKAMIDLVQELRKRLDVELGLKIRISDPQLLDHLCEYFYQSCNVGTKALIKELLLLAGESWYSRVAPEVDASSRSKIYRGQVMDEGSSTAVINKPKSSVRIYRGRVIP
jgi:hypothetical protein